jgi:hypothetical protein
VEVERSKKRLKKEALVVGVNVETVGAPPVSCESKVAERPLLYPLHIIPDKRANRVGSVVVPSQPSSSVYSSIASGKRDELPTPPSEVRHPVLRGIRITFPNGVKISVKEAASRDVYCLVHGM